MSLSRAFVIPLAAVLALPAGAAFSQESAPPAAPSSLVFYFDPGSAKVRPKDVALLDQASRLYRDGKPLVMVVTGATDAVGAAGSNLRLSQQRANAVLRGLVARGIPTERFQILAKGATEPSVPTTSGAAEPGNRRAELTWR
ncbi:MAG: OmpA family protein [Pseudomonadota bacterium]|nr:OmpA family protein [Pseudomonadota bacterium]